MEQNYLYSEPIVYGDKIGEFPIADVIVQREGHIPKNIVLQISPYTVKRIIYLLYEKMVTQQQRVTILAIDWIQFFLKYGKGIYLNAEEFKYALYLRILPFFSGLKNPITLSNKEEICSAVNMYQEINQYLKSALYNVHFSIPSWVFDGIENGGICSNFDSHLALLKELRRCGEDFVHDYAEYLARYRYGDCFKIAKTVYTDIGCREWIEFSFMDMNVIVLYLDNLKSRKLSPEDADTPGAFMDQYCDSEVLFTCLLDAIRSNANNLSLCPANLSEDKMYKIAEAVRCSDIALTNYELVDRIKGMDKYLSYIKESSKNLSTINLVTFPQDSPIFGFLHTFKGLIAVLNREDGETQLYQYLLLHTKQDEQDFLDLADTIYEFRFRLHFNLQLKVVRVFYYILEQYHIKGKLAQLDLEFVKRLDRVIRAITNINIERWMHVFPQILNIVKIPRVSFSSYCKQTAMLDKNGKIDPVYEYYPAARITNDQFCKLVEGYDGYIRFNYQPMRGAYTSFAECCKQDFDFIYDLIVNKGRYGYLLDIPQEMQVALGPEILRHIRQNCLD